MRAGAKLESAAGAVVLLHGRGGSAEDILSLAPLLQQSKLSYLAPQAADHSWYPYSFLAPQEQNEPWLRSALGRVNAVVELAAEAGIAADRVLLCGFSQGACLATEYVAQHARRYAGLIAFTGGLIGPPGAALRHAGDLAGTPALFCSGDPDPHVPWARVQESAEVLRSMGAVVDTRRYPGRPHTISPEELTLAAQMVAQAFGTRAASC